MGATTIRPAYSLWPRYDERLREVVASLTDEQLAIVPGAGRWPLWATIGHLACQRVFWLCDVAGEPGADTTPFRNAAWDCPGDDDLEQVLDASALVEALTSTFRVVEGVLDHWTLTRLGEEVRHEDWGPSWVHARGAIVQRVFVHDIAHIAEVNGVLWAAGVPGVELWD